MKATEITLQIIAASAISLTIILSILYADTVTRANENIGEMQEILLGQSKFLGNMSCVSDSMGLTMGCKDSIYGRNVGPNDTLKKGKIYVYTRGNLSVGHRLIYIIDNDTLIFKGDNNPFGEKVNRSAIKWLVTEVRYR